MNNDNVIQKNTKKIFSRSRIIFYLFAVILFCLAIYYLSTIKTDIQLLKKVNILWLLVAILGQAGTYFFTALPYQKLLAIYKENKKLTVWQLFNASIVSLFTDQVIPSAGISGSGFIFSFFLKRNIPAATAFSVIILQLLTYYTSMIIIILAVCLLSPFVYHFPQLVIIVLAAGILAYLLFAVLVTFVGRKETIIKLGRKVFKIKLLQRFVKRLTELFSEQSIPAEMNQPWSIILQHKKIATSVILYHTGVFLADAFTIFALFRGLGVELSFMVGFNSYLVARIISLLPISPGALILYESSMTYFLTRLGAPLGTSILVTLLYRFLSFWMPMPLGFFLYRKTS